METITEIIRENFTGDIETLWEDFIEEYDYLGERYGEYVRDIIRSTIIDMEDGPDTDLSSDETEYDSDAETIVEEWEGYTTD